MLNREEVGEAAFEIGADAVGEAIGVGVGCAVAGPAGAVGGAVLGSVASHLLVATKHEFLSRLLSTKEQERIITVADLAKTKIEENLGKGRTPRDDGFFDKSAGERSTAEEIFEGTLLVAQREYEERKLPLIANLNANIAFDESVRPGIANRLLKFASELTVQEIVALKVIGEFLGRTGEGIYLSDDNNLKRRANRNLYGLENTAIASDILNLYRSGLVHSRSVIPDITRINPSDLYVGGYGVVLYDLMELHGMKLKRGEESAVVGYLAFAQSLMIKE